MRLLGNYQKGILPFEGRYGEQPAVLMKILDTLAGLLEKHKADEMKKQSKKK